MLSSISAMLSRASVGWRVMDLQFLQEAPRFFWLKRLVEGGRAVCIEIVHDQARSFLPAGNTPLSALAQTPPNPSWYAAHAPADSVAPLTVR